MDKYICKTDAVSITYHRLQGADFLWLFLAARGGWPGVIIDADAGECASIRGGEADTFSHVLLPQPKVPSNTIKSAKWTSSGCADALTCCPSIHSGRSLGHSSGRLPQWEDPEALGSGSRAKRCCWRHSSWVWLPLQRCKVSDIVCLHSRNVQCRHTIIGVPYIFNM